MTKSLKSSFRYSQGPLYSHGELAAAERYLADMGLTEKKDEKTLGLRVYSAPYGSAGSATIYLDELGAHPDLSGTMFITTPAGETTGTTVWTFADKGFRERVDFSPVKALKRLLGLKP